MNPIERLEGIYLASIPPFLYFKSPAVTRYEHSLRAAELVKFVKAPKDVKEILREALLWHDAGSYAFSHLGEKIAKLYGMPDHEERVLELLPENADEEVFRIFERKSELSKFVFNTIDLDNIDNLASYLRGYGREPLYSPRRLAESFSYPPFSFNPPEDELEKWRRTRAIIYRSLLDPNMIILDGMLEEAFLKADRPEILLLTDREAFSELKRTKGREIAMKIEKWELWKIRRMEISPEPPEDYNRVLEIPVLKERPLYVGVDFET